MTDRSILPPPPFRVNIPPMTTPAAIPVDRVSTACRLR